jgi:type IV secretory pathway VirB2 component (pilin)
MMSWRFVVGVVVGVVAIFHTASSHDCMATNSKITDKN